MKTKDFKELRSKDVGSLKKLVADKWKKVVKAKMAAVASKEKNTKLALNIRREIAKILTLIKEKEIIEKITPKEEVKTKNGKVIKGKEKT